VDQDGAESGNLGGLQGTQYGVAQQSGPDFFALKILVDGEASDDHDGNGIGHISPDAAWCFGMGYGANRQGVVADNVLPGADDIGTRSAALFILKRPPPQPVVERGLAALEFGEIVIGAQSPGGAQRLVVIIIIYCSHGAFVFSRRRSRMLFAGGLSSMAVKRLNSPLDKAK
jgi:hypothetical protein